VYIDGGSSGTRVHVFEYRHSLWPAYVQLNLPEKIHSVEPGLSSYAGQPAQAAAALQPLLDFAYREVRGCGGVSMTIARAAAVLQPLFGLTNLKRRGSPHGERETVGANAQLSLRQCL